ncbi:hypothetical protein D9C73_016339 [Collichthys lucidus]|uniref:Uncharacterized protein n=1 Tax=Collichthys lucidus TaxID=240159 RepID=A0A4U5V4S8_COLLU|nr:hypothetical protein D9C73_016339 [Collichthys lucidus]
MRAAEMLLTRRRSQLISSPETHSVQNSSRRPFQQLIWVQSTSIIQGRSSLACSVSLQAKLVRLLNVGRRQRKSAAKKKKTRETVLCFIPRLHPVFLSQRRRGAERLTAYSFPPRNKARTATCQKRKRYDVS